MSEICVHHWRQEPGNIRAPFECVRCGAVKEMPATFVDAIEAIQQKHANAAGAQSPTLEEGNPARLQDAEIGL